MKKLLTILCGISLAIMISANASALQLITDGGFETGGFLHWTVDPDLAEAGWVINDGSIDPPPLQPYVDHDPISGLFDAKTVQTGPGSNELSQSFLVPNEYITSATLSWSDRIENYANNFVEGTQEFRVDILSDTDVLLEEIFSTNPGDLLIQLGPNNRSFDVTSLLRGLAGQSLMLSFLEVDNLNYFNVTVDDISLDVHTTPVPEPATILLLSTGLIGLAGYGRKRRQRK